GSRGTDPPMAGGDTMSRYARQIAVPVFGPEGQERLRVARILVAGAGGLAAPVLQYLVGAGVGFIRLVDPDLVEQGNLHRQTLFRESDLGRAKVDAAADTLAALNPDCTVEAVRARVDPGNAAALADGAEIILDSGDSVAVIYILSDLCHDTGRTFISASVIGTDGYVGGFCGGGPSVRAVFPELPPRLGSCAEDGVLGPVLGVVGSLQAQMSLAILARMTPSPIGRLISYDARLHRFGGFDFSAAVEPVHRPAFIAPDAIVD